MLPLKRLTVPVVKLAWDPRRPASVLIGDGSHAGFIPTGFDDYVRAIYFPRRDVLYVRFYAPDGELVYVTEDSKARAYGAALCFLEALVKCGYIGEWRTTADYKDGVTLALFWADTEYDKRIPAERRIASADVRY